MRTQGNTHSSSVGSTRKVMPGITAPPVIRYAGMQAAAWEQPPMFANGVAKERAAHPGLLKAPAQVLAKGP
jgi:hypothetical protein